MRDSRLEIRIGGTGGQGLILCAKMLADALCAAEVPVLQTADSHTTISVLVWQNRRKAAVSALHEAFALGADEGTAGGR